MYTWLSEAVEQGTTVITANRRIARVLKSEYGKIQLSSGKKAWLSPDIQSLDDWLISRANASADAVPIVLGSHASSILWERCLQPETNDQLLNISGLIRQARLAWQRLHDWQVPLTEVSATAGSRDEKLFAVAAIKYQALLADNHWADDAQLIGLVTALIERGPNPAPEGVVYAGFDRLVPAVARLFAALSDIHCVVTAARSSEPAADIRVAVFDNAAAELRAAGAWARRQLASNPSAHIGIVSPSLDRYAAASERLIREGLAPGWQYGGTDLRNAVNTSYGRRLSEYPAIGIALLMLQWVHRDLTFQEISVLLRSQFVASEETAGRCKLELYMRRLPDQPWSPQAIVRLFRGRCEDADADKWLRGVEHLSSLRAGAVARTDPADWADRIDRLMQQLAWPGTRVLASDEFQLRNRWRELLNDLGRLAIVCPTMSFAEASNRLAALAGDTVYQPETGPGVVQLLGPLEAAGMQFDRLWVAGMDADTWPPHTHPLSLVSRRLQKKHTMPDATPTDSLEYARRVISRLLASAGEVRLSWSRVSEDAENTVSPLIAGFDLPDGEATVDPGWNASSLIATCRFERSPDDPVPCIQQDETVAGGAYTVQRQTTDPFSAFAHGRLRVSELETVLTGLSPKLRGSLIHRALHALFASAPTQDEIRQWAASGVHDRAMQASEAALNRYFWHADPVLRCLLELEQARICDLLENFVAEESRRRAFRIDKVEHDIDYEHLGVRLTLRVDRIDRLSDGTVLIVDYKTGQPRNFLNRDGKPVDLQLVVYACALEDVIGGLVLINIDSRSIMYKGVDARGEWDSKHADLWTDRLAAWKELVAVAIQEVADGDVRINLNQPAEQARPLNILSRIEELRRA